MALRATGRVNLNRSWVSVGTSFSPSLTLSVTAVGRVLAYAMKPPPTLKRTARATPSAIQLPRADPFFRGRLKAAAGRDECSISCKGVVENGPGANYGTEDPGLRGLYSDPCGAHSSQVQSLRSKEKV